MKINNSSGRPLSELGNTASLRPGDGSGGSVGSGRSSLAQDQVQLSNLSASLTAVMGDSATHLKKLAGLAAATLSGGYQVDAGVVSDSIIRHSLQFGSAKYL